MNERVASHYLTGLSCLLAGLTWASSTACTPEETPGDRSGRGMEAVNPGAVGTLTPAETRAAEEARRSAVRREAPSASSVVGSAPMPSAAPEAPDAPPRQLSEELRVMMGQPLACLAGAPGAPLITVSVSTIVDDHGNVLRATASGPLTAEGLACMQARAAGLRFRAPVPRAPIHVTAQIAFRMTQPATEATTTVIEEPRALPPGAVDPMGGSSVPIAPRAGRPVEPRAGLPVEPQVGTSIRPTQGVAIMGPSGTAIGN